MSTLDFSGLVSRHRKYFRTGITRSVEWRESQLTALRTMITNARGVLNHSTRFDPGIRYPPYDRYKMLRELAVPS